MDLLVVFLRRKKTAISCIEEPDIFLKQLRDHDLVPEALYKEVKKRKSKKEIQDGVYKILEWVEKKGGVYVKEFWRCVLEDHIQQKYPLFRTLQRHLHSGSFKKFVKLPSAEKPTTNTDGEKEEKKQEQMMDTGNKMDKEIKKEYPGPSSASSQMIPAKEPMFSSLYRKKTIPVTCGEKKGLLYRGKLAKGEKCILYRSQWFTAVEFERIAGKESCKNWKLSIRYKNIPLQELIKAGRLKCPRKSKCFSRKRRTVSGHVMETYRPF